MRLTLFAIFTLGTAVFAQQHGATGSYGNVLHPGVPSSGSLRAPGARPGNGSFNRGRRSYGTPVYVPFYGYGYGFDNFYPGGYAPPYAPEPPRAARRSHAHRHHQPEFPNRTRSPHFARLHQRPPTRARHRSSPARICSSR